MSTAEELHKRWSRDADYRDAHARLGPEFEVARALIEARRVHPGGAGRADADHAIGSGAAGERPGAAIHAHAGEGGAGDGDPTADSVRVGVDPLSTAHRLGRCALAAFQPGVRAGRIRRR